MDNKAVLQLIDEIDTKLDTLKTLLGGVSEDDSMPDDSSSMPSDSSPSPFSSSSSSPKGGLAALVLEKAKSKKGM